jgi:hypothetical protein
MLNKFILRTDDNMYKWPGFYAGFSDDLIRQIYHNNNNTISINNKIINVCDVSECNDISKSCPIWVIPKITIHENNKYSLFSNYNDKIINFLEINGIHLKKYVQLDVSKINIDNIERINTYDTRIIKNN